MDKTIFMVVKVITIIIIVAAVALQAAIMFGGDDLSNSGALEGYFKLAYAALGIAVVLSIIFFLVAIFGYTKKEILTLVTALVFLGIVYVISNSLADGGNVTAKFMTDNHIDLAMSKSIGGALIFSYIMLALTVFSVLASTVVSVFK